MTDKRNERQEDYSEDRLSVETEVITVDFQKSDALVGQRLDGRFLIVKDLTEGGADVGGMGLVYLAKDLKLMRKEVVVKILKQASLEKEEIARKFQHSISRPNSSGESSNKLPRLIFTLLRLSFTKC